jgi:orotate phosphoribosyltransferase
MELLKNYEGINIKGILVAVDRQEKGTDCEQSATQQVAQDYGLPVHAIANISHIIELLESGGFGEVEAGLLERVKTYRDTYGVN